MREELFTCSLRANRWVHSPPCLWSLFPFLSYLDFSCNMMYIGFNCNIIGWNKSSYLVCVCALSHVRLCGCMDSLSTVLIFPRQESWSGLPFPSPGDRRSPGIEHTSLGSPSLAGGLFTTEPPGKPLRRLHLFWCCVSFLKHLWNSGKGNCVCVLGGGLLFF